MERAEAQARIKELVARYRALSRNEIRAYTEEDTKQEFIQGLFECLGWATTIRREVRKEEKTDEGYPDYSFLINGTTVFYLEAKRLTENLTDHLKQAINYAYIKGVRWAVLTNFEKLMVFDADLDIQSPMQRLFMEIECDNYAESPYFDRLWLLSKEAMLKREIDQQAQLEGRQRRARVEKVLFADLTKWRRGLFEHIRIHRETLESSRPELVDEAIQRFFDRLIFIRTVEDRHLENNILRAVLRQYDLKRGKDKNLFQDILVLFTRMDETYNARLFERHALDGMKVYDENLLRDIFDGLYEVKGGYATYDFGAIDADVLGAVYEQYLSFKAQDPQGEKSIDLKKGAKRKSQGIYYTPKFVVRYIVQQTLGKLLNAPDMTAEKAHQLRILDPACGSGSFLVEAFKVLDEWLAIHGDETDRSDPRQRRLRILRENIYGVDLDPQAVEVAQLNLLLQAAYQKDKLETLHHIKHGNSLIDDEAIAGEHAFNWKNKFPEVMVTGGFDVVIGNPPYVRAENTPRNERDYYIELIQTNQRKDA